MQIPDDLTETIAKVGGGAIAVFILAYRKFFGVKADLRADQASGIAQDGFKGIVTGLREEIARQDAVILHQDQVIRELEVRADKESSLRWAAQERAAELEAENARLKAKA
jgi:hypothetical protein